VLPFTPELSRMPADEFVHEILVDRLHVAAVVVGENFTFGHKAAGDVALLDRLGRAFGFTVEGAKLVTDHDTVFSSTYIRSLIDAGDVAAAAEALGRPHRLEGVVVRGDRRGREIGFPTANLFPARYAAVPADGVYAGWLVRRPGYAGPSRLAAAVSIGTNPTFAGRERRIEAYALDFDGDLYGDRISLDFVARLRDQRVYEGAAPLAAQIARDVEATRAALA